MSLPVRFVLVGTTHPGNIGASARAMKNMGFEELYLVAPYAFPHADATARAAGADDLLERATVCGSLAEAIGACGLVVGTSARQRSISWPIVSPRECAEQVCRAGATSPVAVVFGREKAGLSNQELAHCHLHVAIPSNPAYASLNLAMAVQILAYEIRLATAREEPQPAPDAPPATATELELFFEHLQRALLESGFLDADNPRHLMLRLRRLYLRAAPDANEINILRGILTAAEKQRDDKA